jgi:hypothetical protein
VCLELELGPATYIIVVAAANSATAHTSTEDELADSRDRSKRTAGISMYVAYYISYTSLDGSQHVGTRVST